MLQVKDRSCCYEAWYLIHCLPKKEKYVAYILENQLGLSIFLPEYKTRSRGEIRKLPFFPGYIFAQADLQQVPLSRINTTPGVIRLVAFNNYPQPVPIEVIEVIEKHLSQLDQSQPFQASDVVRIKKKSPLQDPEMIFVGSSSSSDRVTVLINLLGHLTEIQVDRETVEKVSTTGELFSELA